MLPQTNLQLYRVLIERGESPESLAVVRAAYGAARQLFASSFRSSERHFLCHLVGAAGAVAMWGASTTVVAAALVHSAYLYGDFGDGQRRAAPARRAWLQRLIGHEAEQIVLDYTEADWNRSVDVLLAEAKKSPRVFDLIAIKLGDVLDEVSDGGPGYSPNRVVDFNAAGSTTGAHFVLQLAAEIIGSAAVEDFHRAFRELAEFEVPTCLQTSGRAFHVLPPGVSELRRGPFERGLTWAGKRLTLRGAA